MPNLPSRNLPYVAQGAGRGLPSATGALSTGASLIPGIGMIASPAIQALGAWLTGRSADKTRRRERAEDLAERERRAAEQERRAQEERRDRQRQLLAGFLGDTMGLRSRERETSLADLAGRSRTGLEATQLDPFAHAKARNFADVTRSVVEGLGRGGPLGFDLSSIDVSALSPENLQTVGDYFYRNVAEAQPRVPLTGVSEGAERFRTGRLGEMEVEAARYRQEQEDMIRQIMAFLSQVGAPTPPPEQPVFTSEFSRRPPTGQGVLRSRGY